MNVYDSGRVAHILENMGYNLTDNPIDADLIIFNTCHIREKAAEKLFSELGRINKIKEKRKENGLNTIIGVIGCVVQAEDEQIKIRAPYVNFATGPLTYYRIPEILQKIANEQNICVFDTEFTAESKFDYLPENKSNGACSFLPIQEGCDNFCTYCIVPYTRGVETSRPIENIIAEAKQLVASGTLEINLLGQNVNSFHGEDKNGTERNLAYLLNKLSEIDGIERLRYTTSYPADVDDSLIECHRNLSKLMPYLHLPIQSGSDKVLKAMNRRHTSKDYLRVVDKLRDANPKIGFSSDFIVGFPNESDEDFKATLDVVDKVGFIQAFSFKYSRRAGTPAAAYQNQVEEKVKGQRLDILQEKLFAQQLDFNQKSVGSITPVLFEDKGKKQNTLFGRTPYMQNVLVNACAENLNKIKMVKITSAGINSLTGTLL